MHNLWKFATINVWKRNTKSRICGNDVLLSNDFLIVCNPNVCLPIQMQDSAKDNVTRDNKYSPPPTPHTHTRSNSLCWCWHAGDESKNVIMVETEWVINIQGDDRKFLGHLIRHCRSWISSESFKQGHTMRVNTTISTKSEFYSIFCPLLCVYSLQTLDLDLLSELPCTLLKCRRRQQRLWCTRPFPNADSIR